MEAVYFVASSEDGPEAIYFTAEEAFEAAFYMWILLMKKVVKS